MKTTPNEPLKCKFMGVPATYEPVYEGGYEIRFRRSDIPLEGHKLSRLLETESISGEYTCRTERLDIPPITEVEPMLPIPNEKE